MANCTSHRRSQWTKCVDHVSPALHSAAQAHFVPHFIATLRRVHFVELLSRVSRRQSVDLLCMCRLSSASTRWRAQLHRRESNACPIPVAADASRRISRAYAACRPLPHNTKQAQYPTIWPIYLPAPSYRADIWHMHHIPKRSLHNLGSAGVCPFSMRQDGRAKQES
jgi:hypothetical protein